MVTSFQSKFNLSNPDMLKTTLYILLGTLVLAGISLLSMSFLIKADANTVLDHLADNKENSAIKLMRNGESFVEMNTNKMMPLASTVKIIIAIEYAEQAAAGIIDPNELIAVAELNKYFIPNTDGGAHPAWLRTIGRDEVSILKIVQGMILYSSNANTEWLSNKLGLIQINNRLDSLGMKDHSPIYNLVSSLFVGKELFPDLKGKVLVEALRNTSDQEYISATEKIHNKLEGDPIYKEDIGDRNIDVQRVWSDRMVASTVSNYAELMRKINSRTYFNQEVHSYLNPCLEGLMQNPSNQAWLKHAGKKGGSTAFVLTEALYATDKKGNTTEIAYFMNDLNIIQNTKLKRGMNDFVLKILTKKDFLDEVVKRLGE